jgi:hypothetical protein
VNGAASPHLAQRAAGVQSSEAVFLSAQLECFPPTFPTSSNPMIRFLTTSIEPQSSISVLRQSHGSLDYCNSSRSAFASFSTGTAAHSIVASSL